MKFKFLTLTLASISFLMLSSCGDDKPDPTPQKTAEELAVEALTGTGTQSWTIAGGGSVTRDGVDVTSTYPNFEIILNSGSTKTYTSRNSNDLFDSNGNWIFAGANFDKITLSGTKPASGREISFTQTGNNLTLVFTIPSPGSRTNAVVGNYSFKLLKK